MANEYFWEWHVLFLSENRKGISQIYPKIDFVQFIYLLAKSRHLNSIACILVEKSYLGKSPFSLIKRYAHKNGYNSASNGSF